MKSSFYSAIVFLSIFALVLISKGTAEVSHLFVLPSPNTVRLIASPAVSASGTVAALTTETATVTRVIDGDTVELSDGRKLRYIGIDTPESVDPRRGVECFGKEAAEKNRELVLGKSVTLEKDVSETDRFGRLLRYVYVENEGVRLFINEQLVKDGYAQSSHYPPDVKYQTQFDAAETTARESQSGLWSSCPKS